MADDEIRDFWLKSLYEQVGAVHPSRRHLGRWRMNASTMKLLHEITSPSGFPIMPVPVPFEGQVVLLGYPIELDESAEGATFETGEAVSRG